MQEMSWKLFQLTELYIERSLQSMTYTKRFFTKYSMQNWLLRLIRQVETKSF